MKKAFITIGVIIVLLALVICGVIVCKYFSYHSYVTPEKTVKSFVNALNDQNLDDMLNCIDPGEAEYIRIGASFLEDEIGTDSLTKLKTYLPFLSSFADVKVLPQFDVDIINVESDDNSATVKTKLTNKENDSSFEYEFKLVQSNDKWYIHLLSF